MRSKAIILLLFSITYLPLTYGQLCFPVPGTEAIVNGDFENGDDGSSSYGNHTKYVDSNPYCAFCGSSPGFYNIGTNCLSGDCGKSTFNAGFEGILDHTFGDGTGKFLMIDGVHNPNQVAWKQKVPVFQDQTYYFSVWVTSLFMNYFDPVQNQNRAVITFVVTGNKDGQTDTLGGSEFLCPQRGSWEQIFETWSSGSNDSATLQLININGTLNNYWGNDYAIDDVSFINSCSEVDYGPSPYFDSPVMALCNNGGSIDLDAHVTDQLPNILSWFKDSVAIGHTASVLTGVTETGLYNVCIDSNTCIQEAQVEVVADLYLELGPDVHLCDPATATFNTHITRPDLFRIVWKKDGAVLPADTGVSITVGAPGLYSVEISDVAGGSCTGIDQVTVTSDVAEPNHVTFCPDANEDVTFALTGSGKFKWWNAETGGSVVGYGNTLLVPGLTETTTYWAEDTTDIPATAALPNDNHFTGGSSGGNNVPEQNFLTFTANQDCTLDSIDVKFFFYTAISSAVNAVLTDKNDLTTQTSQFASVNHSVPSSQAYKTIPLGFKLTAGHQYQISITAAANQFATMRYEDMSYSFIKYPADYGPVTLTGGQADFVYAGLFNWQLSLPNPCARIPVTATKYCPVNCITPVSAALSPSGSVVRCPDQAISEVLTATAANQGSATFVYSFYKDGGIVQATSASKTYMAGDTGTYFAIIADSSDTATCKAQTPSTVILYDAPTVNAGADDSICLGSSVIVVASGSNSYTWNAGTGASITVSPTASITYTVTGTSLQSCTATDDVVVVVHQPPTADAGAGVAICAGESTTLNGSGGTSYLWNNAITTANPTVAPIVTSTYSLTVTDDNGCTGSDEVVITVTPLPVVVFPDQAEVCISLSSISIDNATPSGGQYSGNFVTGSLFSPSDAGVGSFELYYHYTDAQNCQNNDTSRITVTAAPAPQMPGTAVCRDSSTTLDLTESYTSYLWNTGETDASIAVQPQGTTTYTVTVSLAGGCVGTASAVVAIHPSPDLSFNVDNLSGCYPLTVHFTNTSQPDSNLYWWSFGDELSTENTSSSVSPTHTYAMPGKYNIAIGASSKEDCPADMLVEKLITVDDYPVASFGYLPKELNNFNATAYFQDQSSSDVVTREWDFADPFSGNNTALNVTTPTHQFNNPGTYPVRLTVANEAGCTDTTVVLLTVRSEFTFFAPNAFTPDQNNSNDSFRAVGVGIDRSTWTLQIYTRWGELVFETTDYEHAWDGRKFNQGETLPTGAYSWTTQFADQSGKRHTYKGLVTLVK